MLISIAIACMNRIYNLKKTLPAVIQAAKSSPPCEITILDYSSTDGLDSYLSQVAIDEPDVMFNFPKVIGKQYWNPSHAYNVAFLASHGEYIILLNTEISPSPELVDYIRNNIIYHPEWMHCGNGVLGLIVVNKKLFVEIGGYDERFTVYGT